MKVKEIEKGFVLTIFDLAHKKADGNFTYNGDYVEVTFQDNIFARFVFYNNNGAKAYEASFQHDEMKKINETYLTAKEMYYPMEV